jgi:hypothetical protein
MSIINATEFWALHTEETVDVAIARVLGWKKVHKAYAMVSRGGGFSIPYYGLLSGIPPKDSCELACHDIPRYTMSWKAAMSLVGSAKELGIADTFEAELIAIVGDNQLDRFHASKKDRAQAFYNTCLKHGLITGSQYIAQTYIDPASDNQDHYHGMSDYEQSYYKHLKRLLHSDAHIDDQLPDFKDHWGRIFARRHNQKPSR